jgi:hypothetical protein
VKNHPCEAGSVENLSKIFVREKNVSGDMKLYQYRRFENVVFSSWNPYMKFVFLFVFFVSHVILMGCNSHIRETWQI